MDFYLPGKNKGVVDVMFRSRLEQRSLLAYGRHFWWAIRRTGRRHFFYWRGLPCTARRLLPYVFRAVFLSDPRERISENPFGKLVGSGAVFFINLDKRNDRRLQLEKGFSDLGLAPPKRFSAVLSANGALGCARSHLEVLRSWSEKGTEGPICILEDDLEFLASRSEIESAVCSFLSDENLDVFLFGYRTRSLLPRLPSGLRIVTESLTTSGYIAKPSAQRPLLRSFQMSVDLLSNGHPPSDASIDVVWQSFQCKELTFATGPVRMARQRKSYSDIEGMVKDRGL